MEVVGLVGCATCWALAANVIIGMSPARHASGWGARAAGRQLRRLYVRLGATPLVAALLGLDSWRMLADALARRMGERGLRMGREESCALAALALVALSLLAGLLARSMVGVVAGAVICCVGVFAWHSSRLRARERALIDEMPEVFRTLSMALGSGETLTQAIEFVGVHEHGYAGEAFVHAALRLRCGASTEDAMAELGRELDAPGVGLLTTALVIAQRTGSPLRGLFQSSAQLVERQGEYERMLSVKTAQVRLSVRIVCLLPCVLVCLLSLISVDFQQGLRTIPGAVSLLLAATLDGIALLVIRHLMRGVL